MVSKIFKATTNLSEHKPENWWVKGVGISQDIANPQALAKLAVRLAATARPAEPLIAWGPDAIPQDDSEGDPGYHLADERLEEYYKVIAAVSQPYRYVNDGTFSNTAAASCTQFVTHCIRATVDPDCHQMSPQNAHIYFEQDAAWSFVGKCDHSEVDSHCEPGDVLCFLDDKHTALYVGHALIAKKFPEARPTTNVCEARYTKAIYPECVTYDADHGYKGNVAVFRYNGTSVKQGTIHPAINAWELLAQ